MAADEIEAFVERLLPNPTERRAILTALAGSIDLAHKLAPGGWGVTVRRDRDAVRFNVGRMQAFLITAAGPMVVVDGRRMSGAPEGAVVGKPRQYAALDEALNVDITPSRFNEVFTQFEAAHHALITTIASRQPGYAWKDASSPGFLAYLERFLGRKMPTPEYAMEIEPPTRDEEKIEARLKRLHDSLLADDKLITKNPPAKPGGLMSVSRQRRLGCASRAAHERQL